MNKEKMINCIIQLPDMFYSKGNISIYDLLKETGYFENHNLITEAHILKKLISNPEYINSWLSWSEDKRSTSGWYFSINEKNNCKYDVGYFRNNKRILDVEYTEIKEACSYFIKREIENIRNS